MASQSRRSRGWGGGAGELAEALEGFVKGATCLTYGEDSAGKQHQRQRQPQRTKPPKPQKSHKWTAAENTRTTTVTPTAEPQTPQEMDKSLVQPRLLMNHKELLQTLRVMYPAMVFPQRTVSRAFELLYDMRKFAFATKPKVKEALQFWQPLTPTFPRRPPTCPPLSRTPHTHNSRSGWLLRKCVRYRTGVRPWPAGCGQCAGTRRRPRSGLPRCLGWCSWS